jgi:hypothetical protein
MTEQSKTRLEKLREWRKNNPEKRAEQIRRANKKVRGDPKKWAKKLE